MFFLVNSRPNSFSQAKGIPRFASGFQKKHSALSIQPPEITANYTQAHNDDRWLNDFPPFAFFASFAVKLLWLNAEC